MEQAGPRHKQTHGRQRVRWLLGVLTTLAALLILSCAPSEPPLRVAVPLDTPELVALQRTGIADTKLVETDAHLRRLLDRETAGSMNSISLLLLRGWTLGMEGSASAIAEVCTTLDKWPNPDLQPAASLACRFVRARQLLSANRLTEARALLADVDSGKLAIFPTAARVRMLRLLARLNDGAGHIETAIALYLRALSASEQTDALWLQALCKRDLAQVYLHADQADRAAALINEALALAERDPDPMTLTQIHIVRNVVLSAAGQPDEAMRSAQASISHAREAGSAVDEAVGMVNLADNHLRAGNFELALKLSEAALPLARKLKVRGPEQVALSNLGLANISLGRIAEGKRLVRQSIAIDQRKGSVSSVADSLAELGGYLETAGDHAGALEAFLQHREILDQMQRENRTIAEAQQRYEGERRALEIELTKRDNEIADERLRRGRLQTRLWILLACSFLAAAAVVALLYRRMRLSNAALKHSNLRLKVQGEIDPLTGLSNRRHFQLAIQALTRDGQLDAAVYLLDIDHFKRINDGHGHAVGDAVLIEVARRMRSVLRAEDLLVRWGGEEFLVVTAARRKGATEALAQRLLDVIATQPIEHGASCVAVTASIGFASFPLPSSAPRIGWERAVSLVDQAMYLAKHAGRNRAFGVDHVDAEDEGGLDELVTGMASAWREGRIGLTALNGWSHKAVEPAL